MPTSRSVVVRGKKVIKIGTIMVDTPKPPIVPTIEAKNVRSEARIIILYFMAYTVCMQKATFAGGCFWCTEAVFEMIKGVSDVTSGYAGGLEPSPTYESVSSGSTGHTEAIQITYDPKVIAYSDLLYIFLRTHDPTTRNKQGPDTGSQYRSVIFFGNAEEKNFALKAIEDAQKNHADRIVTEIVHLTHFYKAEDYHQDYYKKNSSAMYCKLVIDPKIQKLKKVFKDYVTV